MKLQNPILTLGTFALCLTIASVANAATLKLSDGSSVEGQITKIHEGKVFLTTQFAGDIEIPQEMVTNLASEEPVVLRVESGEVFQGTVSSDSIGEVEVASGNGAVSANLAQVVSAWNPGETDPIVAAEKAALEGQLRKWSYVGGLNITGSDGNTDNLGAGLRFEAKLEGPDDRLLFYASYDYQETEGVKSEDELIGGVTYTNFFSEKTGWYIREELERDPFENIDFRSTTALGLTRRFIQEEDLSLEGRAGLSYRHESYSDTSIEDGEFPGLDFGLDFAWQFAEWGKWTTWVVYLPSIEDFAEYRLEQESAVDFPMGTSEKWIMRIGLANQYNSKPLPGLEKLDTTYFIRMILNWK